MEFEREVDIKDYLKIIRRRLWIILGVIGITIILIPLYFFYSPPLYTSTSTILVKKVESLFGGGYFPSPTEEELTNHIYLLKTDPVLRKTATSFTDEELKKMEFDSVRVAYLRIKSDIENGRIEIRAEGESRIIKIKVTETNQHRSYLIANKLAEVYRDFDIEMNREDAHSTYNFIAKQIEMVKRDLEKAESVLREFKEEYGILGVSAEVEGFIEQMSEIENEYRKASVEADVLEKELESVKSRLGSQEKVLLSEASETSYEILQELKKQLTKLENQRADLLIQGYAGDDQKIKRVEESIGSIKQRMNENVRQLLHKQGIVNPLEEIKDLLQKSIYLTIDLAVAQTRQEAFKDVLNHYQQKLKEIPERELKLARLEREKIANEKIYMMLLEKREQAQITEVSERGGISILDFASKPDQPNLISKVKRAILFLILGLLLGIGVGFVVDYFDSAIRDESEITRMTGHPVLTMIPRITNNSKNLFILTGDNYSHSAAESFRRLRTNIKLSSTDGLPSSILVTGPNQGCGKSLIATNIAISFSHILDRVLLVDTDLRRPSIESNLGISQKGGLTDLLIGEDDDISVFKIDGVNVLPSGTLPPNPSELLDSQKMRELIRKWENEYDLLILDSPPILSVSDSIILANEVETTLIVVAYGETTRGMIEQTSEMLERLGIKTLGYVLNKVLIKREYGYYSYHYHEYY